MDEWFWQNDQWNGMEDCTCFVWLVTCFKRWKRDGCEELEEKTEEYEDTGGEMELGDERYE